MKKINSLNQQTGLTKLLGSLLSFLLLTNWSHCQCTYFDEAYYNNLANGCQQNKVGEPFLEANCFAPVDRYLARCIHMSNVVGVNSITWDNPNDDLDCNNTGNASNQGCDPNYGPCKDFNGYCPDRYWCDIDMCVELNAAFLYDAAALYGGEANLIPGVDFYGKASQLIKDVNNAYDCAGLQRPIIGASIYEYVDPSQLKWVTIPETLITDFESEMTTQFVWDHYHDGNSPKTGLKFLYGRIVSAPILFSSIPTVDLTKIEARMWFYYCAKKYIDDGYQMLHMGDLQFESYFDKDNGYAETYKLFNRIREYAASKNTFILLDGWTSEAMYYNDKFLYDFNTHPLRPDETQFSTCMEMQLVSGDNTSESFSEINHYPSGTSPNGCFESEREPYCLRFDNYGGYSTDPVYTPIENGSEEPNDIKYAPNWVEWGYDETRWFYENGFLSSNDACQVSAIDFLCDIRSMESTTRGYIMVPGREVIGPYDEEIGWYRLWDHDAVKKAIYDPQTNTGVWTPKDNTSINMSYTCSLYEDDCDARHFKGYKSYTFTVPTPDCSTVYTWHIQNPDGSWQPFTYGTTRSFTPPVSGNYQIHLRQDNLGYAPITYGTIEHTFIYTLATDCCGPYHEPLKNGSEESALNSIDQNLNSDFTIAIYPNPSRGNFTLEILSKDKSKDENVQMRIRDFVGKLIFSENLIIKEGVLKNQINLPLNLSSGIYFLTITNENGISKTEKIVIQN